MDQADSQAGVPTDELATLAEIGRALLAAQLDEAQLCELIYELAGHIVPTESFQLGLFDGDNYRIKVWVKDGQRQPPAAFVVPEGHGIIGWLRAARKPLLVRDFAAELDRLPARPTYIGDHPPRSAVFLPLAAADTVIGAISIQSSRPAAFDENHLRLLAVLANQSASALHNARLYARGQERLNALLAISEVGRKLTSILDLSQLLAQVVELISLRFGYYHVQIFLVERGGDHAQFKASSGHALNEKWQREGRSPRIGVEGIIGWVAQRGEPLLVNDVALEPRYIPDDPRLLPDTRAELAVPLRAEDEILGVLDVQSAVAGAFGPNDLFILNTLADQVAVAVKSARAYEAQREESWVTTVMLQVSAATSQAESVDAVLDAAVRVTAMLAGVASCSIWLWDEEFQAFQYAASYGLWPDGGLDVAPEAALRFFTGDWPALDRLRATKAPIVSAAETLEMPELLRLLCPGGAVALLPMLNKGAVFGVLGVSFGAESGEMLNERRLSMLSGIAHQVAASVDNSRLAAAREEEAWISTILLQVAEAIGRLQPVDLTLEQVARLAPAVTGVDRCAVLLRNADGSFQVRKVHALQEGLAEAYQDWVIHPGDLPLLDDACQLGQPLVVDDVCNTQRVPEAWTARFGSCTILVVPLLVADEVIGALVADDVETPRMFSERRVRILSGIASQAAIAIENARLQAQEAERAGLTRELELAHDIQQSLLPQAAPVRPGYQIAYRWNAAREVGGDLCDFVELPQGNLGLLVADVSGKGIPAALYMMFARTLLRAVAFSGRDPAAMLMRTNELMVADSTSDYFVTAYYGVLDPGQHRLTYASAGHNLAYFAAANGDPAQAMITKGIPLGILPAIEIEQQSLLLAPGDIVLFYTDGVSDAMNAAGEEFGSERLSELLCARRAESAEAIADAFVAAVNVFAGGVAQYDDFTMIVLKRDAAQAPQDA
ncbi:MAG: phosphoserine phosphatase RsbU/P [Chloroflexota bacterium]|nr:phosphoserine phosphatase RsbU/P [Chloroflexota bacterium]